MNENLSQALADQLQSSTQNVDVFLALEALSRAAPAVAFEAITTFLRSAPANQLPLARNAMLVLAGRAPALLVNATLDENEKVADAAKQALLTQPSNEAFPLYLRMAKSKSVDEACSGFMYLGRVSSPQARAIAQGLGPPQRSGARVCRDGHPQPHRRTLDRRPAGGHPHAAA